MNTILRIVIFASASSVATFSNAEQLGRLFFTPEQRTQKDYSKLQSGDSGRSGHALTVNGIVQKHGGKRTAWINGVPQQAGNSDERSPNSIPVAVPGLSKPVKVRSGRRY